MTSKLTREEMQEIISALRLTPTSTVNGISQGRVADALSESMAAMDSEPVAWLLSGGGAKNVVCFDSGNAYADPPREVTPLYRHAQPAPIAPEGLRLALSNAGIAAPESDEMLAATHEKYTQTLVDWVRGRKAFRREPVVPEILPCSVELKPGLVLDRGCKTTTLLTALRSRADYLTEIDAMTPEERAEHDASIEAFKVILNGGLS